MPVRLSGVSLDGWFAANASEPHLRSFITAGDLELLASWRFTHVRLPLDEALLDQPAAWDVLDATLATCARIGLACALALRARQEHLFAEETRWQRLIERWQTLASRYAAWPGGLLYDLLDRPDPPDDLPEEALRALGAPRLSFAAARRARAPGATAGRAWSAFALKLTQAIRGVDHQHTIVVQANRADPATFAHLRSTRDANTLYSFECFEPRAFTWQGVPPHPPTPSPSREEGEYDGGTPSRAGEAEYQGGPSFPSPPRGRGGEPAKRAVAERGAEGAQPGPHPQGQGITYPGVIEGERWDRQRLERWLQPALDFAARYEVPLYLGAFGASAAAPRSAQLTWVRSTVGLCHAHGIGWAYWTYRTYPGAPFGLVCDMPPWSHRLQHQNPQRLDYDLLGVLQSEA